MNPEGRFGVKIELLHAPPDPESSPLRPSFAVALSILATGLIENGPLLIAQ